jgi:hypothetical protein
MDEDTGGAAVNHDVLEDVRDQLARSDRFQRVEAEPEAYPDSVKAYFDTGFYPSAIQEVFLEVCWFQNSDFNAHYRERYSNGEAWECRWDRHPNDHNAREHFHPGPGASREDASDASYSEDWRDVLEGVLRDTDERMRGFWQ